jgi:hypothetical protein
LFFLLGGFWIVVAGLVFSFFLRLGLSLFLATFSFADLAFAVREKTYPRGSIILDGKKLVKQAQDNKEEQEDLTLDIVFLQQGHVEYCRYLKQHKAGQKGHFQAIAICGPGRMFAAPGGSFFDKAPNIAKDIVVKALSATNMYCITKSYFTSVNNNKRTDMVSAKAMFQRDQTFLNDCYTRRTTLIQSGIQAEADTLSMRALPLPAPNLSSLEMGMLDVIAPYPMEPGEDKFMTSPTLTYKRLLNHNPRCLKHLEDLALLQYDDNNNVPPWATGTPVALFDTQTKENKLKQRRKVRRKQSGKASQKERRTVLPNIIDRLPKDVSWQMKEPPIVIKTRALFGEFLTKDVDNVLMGLHVPGT